MISELLNPITMLLHMVNAAILFIAVYFLLYKPVRTFMLHRTEEIAQSLIDAAHRREEAEALLASGRNALKETNLKAADIVAKAAQEAQEQANEIVRSARDIAADIEKKANADAENLHVHAHEAASKEAATLAVAIAQKLLQREVGENDHDQLIAGFLSNADGEEGGAV